MRTIAKIMAIVATLAFASVATALPPLVVTPTNGPVPLVVSVAATNGWLYQLGTNGVPWLKDQWGVFKLVLTNASSLTLSAQWQPAQGAPFTNLSPVLITATCTNCGGGGSICPPCSVTPTNAPYCPTNAPVTITNIVNVAGGGIQQWTTNGVDWQTIAASNFPTGYMQRFLPQP